MQTKYVLTHADVVRIVAAAREEAVKNQWAVTIAVVDDGGHPLALERLDGCAPIGAYIATEATLSFLGIGLQPPAISWGQAISEASGIGYIRSAPHMLLFPSIFLSATVLAFILLGEAVRDALDPKLR